MPLSIDQIRYERSELEALHAVVTHGGFAAAGRANGVAAGNLSRRVRRLERTLGTELIVTVEQRSIVTAAGRRVGETAERISAILSSYPPQLRLRHLEVLGAVHESGSITAAAHRMAVPQPALSRLLRRTEHHLGTPLVSRGGTGITPTPSGHRLIEVLHQVHREHRQLLTYLMRTAPNGSTAEATGADSHQDSKGANAAGERLPSWLRLAVASVLPAGRLITHLATQYPHVRWQTQPFDHTHVIDQLRDRDLDLAVWFRGPDSDWPLPEMNRQWLFDEPVWLAVATSSPLASRDEVAFSELADHNWIARPDGPLRRLLDQTCRSTGFSPLIAHESENNRVIRSLVAAEHGVTLAAPGIPPAPDITVVPLSGVPDLQYHLLWDTDRLPPLQAEGLCVTVRDWYHADALRSPVYWSWRLAHGRHGRRGKRVAGR